MKAIQKIILLGTCLFYVLQAQGRKQVYSIKEQALPQGQTTIVNVDDPFYDDMSSGSSSILHKETNTIIEFYLDYSDATQFSADMYANINLLVSYSYFDGTQWVDVNDQAKTGLFIEYNENGTSKERVAIRIPGGGHVEVEAVATADPLGHPTASFPQSLKMDVRIETERFFPLTASSINAGDLTHQLLNATKELEISWQEIDGAEYYDLEWAYVNDYHAVQVEDELIYSFLTPEQIHLQKGFFKTNSTRVSLHADTLSYKLPLLYEHGYVAYRLRAVGKTLYQGRERYFNGQWSASDEVQLSNYVHKQLIQGHEHKLNWQLTRNFAEEGKNKSAISYFDGSLRNRQVVSKINTENEAIVGETVYDSEGRASIQILPVPANDERIQYYPNFNRKNATPGIVPYSWRDFDTDTEDDACVLPPEALSDQSGAANYYSPENPNTDRHHEFLPDAEGYPFTQIEYTRDNTGRIANQSGVGLVHQLGSGHETKYLYSKVNQYELDTLFGAEVGHARHYKRNTVVDPNGQVSVSYLDPQGRVVATALAGESPQNLEQLPSLQSVNHRINLLENQPNDARIGVGEGYRGFTSQIVPLSKGDHQIIYTLDAPDPFRVDCIEPIPNDPQFCAPCALNLELYLRSACGDSLITVNQAAPGKDCAGAGSQTIIDSVRFLDFEEYTLSKYVSVDEVILDSLTAEYVKYLADQCLLTIDDFLEDEFAVIDTTECDFTCEKCLEELEEEFGSTAPEFGDIEFEAYKRKAELCEKMCGRSGVKCLIGYMGMLADVSPHGQYGLLLDEPLGSSNDPDAGPGEDPLTLPDDVLGQSSDTDGNEDPFNTDIPDNPNHELSVYNTNNKLDVIRYFGDRPIIYNNAHWRNPMVPYQDENGVLAYITCVARADNDGILYYEPALASNEQPGSIDDRKVVRPEALKHLSDFVDRWEPSWAKSLVFFHPEYPIYEDCIAMEESHKYMEAMMRANYQEATLDGKDGYGPFLKPESNHFITDLNPDPFFNHEFVHPDYKIIAQYRNDNYMRLIDEQNLLSISELAYAEEECAINDPAICPPDLQCMDGQGVFDEDTWNNQRGMYMDLRLQIEETILKNRMIRRGYYNGCIGNSNYVPTQHDVHIFRSGWFNNWFGVYLYFLNNFTLCNANDYDLYVDKQAIFPLTRNLIDNPFSSEEFCEAETPQALVNNLNDPALLNDIEPQFCDDKFEYVSQWSRRQYELKIYEDCGQCPMAKDLENALNNVAFVDTIHLHEDFRLGCSDNSQAPLFNDFLLKAMGFGDISAPPGNMMWQVNNTTDNTTDDQFVIDATIVTGNSSNTQTCDVSLTFDYAKVPSGNFVAEKVNGICCLNYSTDLDLQGTGLTFTFGAKYMESDYEQIELSGEGSTSCLRLDTCELKPLCTPTSLAGEFFSLFSAIAFGYPDDISGITGPFFASNGVELMHSPFNAFVTEDLVNNGITSSAAWTNPQVGIDGQGRSTVTGVLSDGLNTDNDITVSFTVLEPFPMGTTFDDIVKFSAFRPDLDVNADPATDWFVNAKVEVATNEYEMIKMSVSVLDNNGAIALPLMSCTDAISIDQ